MDGLCDLHGTSRKPQARWREEMFGSVGVSDRFCGMQDIGDMLVQNKTSLSEEEA